MMLFGRSRLTNEKKLTRVRVGRALLPLVSLLILCCILFMTNSPFRSGGERSLAPYPVAADDGNGARNDSPRPRQPVSPDPFVERPEILFEAAGLDRTKELSEPAITYLFQKIRTDEAGFRTEVPALAVDKGDQVWKSLIADPDMFRGRLISVKGRIVASEPGDYPLRLEGLDIPNPSGLDRRFESYFVDTDHRLYLVTTLKKGRELRHSDAARLRAYFCQLYTNEVEHDGQLRLGTIPFLVGEDYEFIDQDLPSTTLGDSLPIIIVLIVLPLVAFGVIFVLHLRTRKAFRRLRERHQMPPAQDRS